MFEPRNWAFVICMGLVCSVSALAQDEAAEGDPGTEEAGEEEGSAEALEGASSTPPAPEAKTTPVPPEMNQGTYTVRLRDLEGRVNRLKEQIFRSKARLSLLAETVLDKKIAGATANIIFRNEMGGSFRLVKATFLLDGALIFNKSEEGDGLADKDELNLFDGPVMPGDHTLSAVLHYRGHGYGIFSYLKGYSFKTRSSRTFTVNEGKTLHMEVVGYEKGTVTTPLEERPDVRYVVNMSKLETDDSAEGEETREGAQ